MGDGPQVIKSPRAARPAPAVIAGGGDQTAAPTPRAHPATPSAPSFRNFYDLGQPADPAAATAQRQQQGGATHQAQDYAPATQRGPTFLPLREGAVAFDATRPWIARAQPGVDDTQVSLQLYGVDVSEAEAGPSDAPIIQNLLQSHQHETFRRQMEARLATDLEATKDLLVSTNLIRGFRVTETLKFWANARDYTDATGTSYFDRFLDALDEGRITVTHSRHVPLFPSASWETGTSEKSYLDDLFGDAGSHIGEVIGLIASNSVKHGGYRPAWHQMQRMTNGQDVDTTRTPGSLISRGVNEVLDRLAGATSSSESNMIRDLLVGLPPQDQARTLKGIMDRHDDMLVGSTSFGIARFGEPTPQHMAHYLMENLDDDHRKEVLSSLQASGTLSADAIAGLRQGRTWAGRWLPMTTYAGENAAQFWADMYVDMDNRDDFVANAFKDDVLVMGLFASLWTPDTATDTIVTLSTAGLGGTVARAPVWVQRSLAIAGTAPTSYQLTQSLIELGTGEDIYTGEALSETEMWTRGILAASNAIMLGTGFYGMRQMGRAGPVSADAPDILPAGGRQARALGAGGADDLLPPAGRGSGGGQTRPDMRIIGVDDAGNVRVVARDPMSGDVAYLRINQHTGDGILIMPRQGAIQIRAGEVVPSRPALTAGNGRATGQGAGQGRPAAPEILTGGGDPLGPRMLTGGRQPRALIGAEPDPHDLSGLIPEVFGPVAAQSPRLIVTPRGHVLPELPPIVDDVPIYWGDLPPHLVPDIAVGQRPTMVGPVPEGVTLHEIFPSSPTGQTVNQMRRAPSGAARPGAVRGEQLEIFWTEGSGPLAYRHGGGVRTPITGRMRFPDVRSPTIGRRVMSFETKNYLRWIGSGGAAREVPLNTDLRHQVASDAFEMIYGFGNHRPIWVFGDAPPSQALANYLRQANIPYIIYGDRLVP